MWRGEYPGDYRYLIKSKRLQLIFQRFQETVPGKSREILKIFEKFFGAERAQKAEMTKKTAKFFARSGPESMESTFTQWVDGSIRIDAGIRLLDKRVYSGSGPGFPVRL